MLFQFLFLHFALYGIELVREVETSLFLCKEVKTWKSEQDLNGSYFYAEKMKEVRYMKKMDKLFNWFSMVFGVIGGVLSYWLGGWDVLLKTIVFLAVADYITGVIKGIYTKKLSSETGFKGLLKKIVMFIVIAVSFSIQELIGNTIPLREVVIMFYICNEALSLLENAAVFVPIPDKLRDVLIQLRDKDTEEDSEGE